MVSITPFAAGNYLVDRSTSDLLALRGQINALSNQLHTGRVAETYGELGAGRADSLAGHAMLGALNGYDAAITSARPRLDLTTASLAQIAKATATLRNGLLTNATDSAANTRLAREGLDSALDALNQQIGGQYVFGGRLSGAPPVLSTDIILNGDASDPARPLAGLRTLVAEQMRADLGTGSGRLTQSSPSPTSIRLQEDADAGARANFGFTLAGAPVVSGSFATVGYAPGAVEGAVPRFAQAPAAGDRFRVVVNLAEGGQKTYDLAGADLADISSAANAAASLQALVGSGRIASVQSAAPPGLTATFANATAPAALTINVVSQPNAGDKVAVRLALRDGTTTTLVLQAQTSADAASVTDFAIGATPAATAQNLSGALQRALNRAAETTLAASATARATADFFAGSAAPGLAPRRIDFSGAAPAYAQTPSASTVVWYRGEIAAGDPRAAIAVRTSATATVGIGARANEDAIRAAVAGFAALAVSDMDKVTAATPATAERWKALGAQALTLLPGKDALDGIAGALGLASSALADAQAQNKTVRTILQSHLDHLENAPTEELVVRLVDVQNRLQASYQVTSMLSKLSLLNYLR
ncbi:hypothetical protein [Bradyrhizobium sp. 2TAF24]|uniref:hypothetical protein n=1 Tax=Bradyrhizobium sp. 2TAF24 TaxID=3233011 RepID=UPI003F8EF325